MRGLGTFLKRHRWAVLGACLVAAVHLIPYAVAGVALRSEGLTYRPVLLNGDELLVNGVKAKMFAEEGRVSGELNLSEGVDETPSPYPPLPARLLGTLARVTGDVETAMGIADAVFPALSFFLAYMLAIELGLARSLSLFAGAATVFIPRFFALVPLLTTYYQGWLSRYLFAIAEWLPFDRIDDPQLTVWLFLLAIYLVLRSVRRGERITTILAGLSFGLLFYTYFYYWTYLSVALVAAGVLFWFTKRADAARRIGGIFLLGLAVSIPYWVNFIAVTQLPFYRDFTFRLGPEFGKSPYLSGVVLFAYVQHILLAAGLWLSARRRFPVSAVFLIGLLLPVFVVYNFQIITGYNPQPDHWVKPRQIIVAFSFILLLWELLVRRGLIFHRVTGVLALCASIPLVWKGIATENGFVAAVSIGAAVTLGILAFFALRENQRLRGFLPRAARVFAVLFAVFLLVKGSVVAATLSARRAPRAFLPPEISAVFQWMKEEIPDGDVVGSVSFQNIAYIPFFTDQKTFVPYGINTFISNEEILDRFIIVARLLGVDRPTFGRFFATLDYYPPATIDLEGISYLFGDAYRARERESIFSPADHPPYWSEEEHRRVLSRYDAWRGLSPNRVPFRLDYLLITDRDRSFAPGADTRLLSQGFLRVYDRAGVTLYKVPGAGLEKRI